jgi:GTP-binding protein
MGRPVVAIIGRPNVGKSSFFNYVSGKRISIVEDTPGVTRDRIYTDVEWRGRKFLMIDTGGIEPKTNDFILKQMKRQAELAIDTADILLFMVDVKDGLTAADMEIATILRKSKKPIIVAVNKVDRIGQTPPEVYEFYNIGLETVCPISSIQGLGMGDLLDEIYNLFKDIPEEVEDDSIIKVAVIGKPNAGKSSIINRILGEERLIVSDVPGTTRDAIDTYIEQGDDKFIFIDTAGIRKKSKITENIERYSIVRAWAAVERADVCVIMIDATEGVTEQDTKIAGFAHDSGKASVVVVNKWDLVEKETGTLEEYRKQVYEKLGYMTYAPILFISAKTGQRVGQIMEHVKTVYEQSVIRISTGTLNDVLNDAIAMVQPPSDKGRRLKIYYMTQVSIKPPTFVLFVNNQELMHYSYRRYIENQLRKSFGFYGTPIHFNIREKNNDKE